MQTLPMIDMGTQVPEINTPNKSSEAKDKLFGKVLNDQQRSAKAEAHKTEAGHKPVENKTVEHPDQEPKSVAEKNQKTQPHSEKHVAQAGQKVKQPGEQKRVAEKDQEAKQLPEPKCAVAVEQEAKQLPELNCAVEEQKQPEDPAQFQIDQDKVQQLVIDLLQALVAENNPQQPSEQQGEEQASSQELLTRLLQQLDDSHPQGPQAQGEQVVAGIDLTPLVEQLQELSKQQDTDESLKQLVARLAEQLAAKKGLEANSEQLVGLVEQPVQQIPAVSLESLGKARQLLQQAIDKVAGQHPDSESGELAEVQQPPSDPQSEDVQPLANQPVEKAIDPRFAGLLKPRQEEPQKALDVKSLRERVQGDTANQQPAQATTATEQPIVAADAKPQQNKVEAADLLTNDPKQAVDNLLRQLQGSQQQGQHQPLNNLKPMPMEARMMQLPSGQQVAESQVFDQVVARMSGSFNGESGRMVLRLHPAELGSLRLDLKVEGDRLQAHLHAQSQQVQEVLQRHLPHLRNALAEQGLKIDRFQVDVEQHSHQQGQQGNLAQQQNQQQPHQQRSWQPAWDQDEQLIPLTQLLQNSGGGISLHV